MRVLIVSSGNSGNIASFVLEQGLSLRERGLEIEFFSIRGKSYHGYLGNLSRLNRKISEFNPDMIHAHYGLSALLANLQRKIPVICTFHGSDIWVFRKNRVFSQLAHIFSRHTIVVDPKMVRNLPFSHKTTVIPCGVNLKTFFKVDKYEAILKMKLPNNKVNILFSSKYDYYEKNYPLALKTIDILGEKFNLIELKGYSRSQVNLLLNGCDLALMTSISEGSPQFIKEAMACNCPVVSTNVGDVAQITENSEGCYISSFDPVDIANKIMLALEFRKVNKHTSGRERIIKLGLDSETIASKVIEVYKKQYVNSLVN